LRIGLLFYNFASSKVLQDYKNIISRFFIALWAISQFLQFGHEATHHIQDDPHEGCHHSHHNEVKKLDNSIGFVTSFDDCKICEFEWFNSHEISAPICLAKHQITLAPIKIGKKSQSLAENWISSSVIPRPPPVKS